MNDAASKSNGSESSYLLGMIEQLRSQFIDGEAKTLAAVRELHDLVRGQLAALSMEHARLHLVVAEVSTKVDRLQARRNPKRRK